MFCARCGEQIPEASELCPLCRREASLRLEPPPPPPPTPAPAAAAAPAQVQWPGPTESPRPPARRPDLRGVGGWLLFFCLALILLSPLFTFIRLWGHGFELDAVLDLALTAFGFFVGIMVWNVHPRAFLLLWIYFGVTAALLVVGIVTEALSPDEAGPRAIIPMVRGLVSTIIWFLYFKQSDRVQATFGRNL